MKKILFLIIPVVILGIFIQSCKDTSITDSSNPLRLFSIVEPTLVDPWSSGNAETECTQAGGDCWDFAFKLDSWDEIDENGTYTSYGNSITISNSNGTTFDWSSAWPVCKVIVKGGTGALIYDYGEGAYSDQGLHAPLNSNNGNYYEVSHVTFCFRQPDNDECFDCETGFGGNTQGGGKSWWFAYNTNVGGEQTIWAGKNLAAGTVNYTGGQIVIDLDENWSLQQYEMEQGCVIKLDENGNPIPYDEPVKIQGYTDLPGSRPAAGLFTDYKGNATTITVPGSPYFVIHLDLLHSVPCD